MQRKIVDITTTVDCNIKLIYYENGDKKIEIVPFKWYFLITKEDYEKNKDELNYFKVFNSAYSIKYIYENDKWVKVYCKYPQKIRYKVIEKIKSLKIQTYEADLSLSRRYWIDSNFHIAEPEYFSLLFFDIEVDDTNGGLVIGRDKIIAFSAKDNKGNEFQIIEENERLLLKKIINLIQKYDIIIGWNSRNYDKPYLEKRCSLYNLKFPDVCHIDLMQRMIHAYRFDVNIRSFSLDFIAERFLGKRKLERKTRVIKIFKEDFERFKEYSMTDSRLLYDLNEKYHIILTLLKQAYWCNVTPRSLGEGGGGLYTLLDTLILKASHKRGLRGFSPLYTYKELDEMSEEESEKLYYPGGLVLKPKPGLYKNVYIFDFKTLYPTIILTSNIGFDTLDKNGDIKNPSGSKFKSEPQSILAEIITELLTKRKEYKEKKLELIEKGLKETPEYEAIEADEVVVKELGNSVYGILGAKWGRYFFAKELVESVTLMGQYLLRSLDTFFSNKGYKVLLGDTDSVIFVGSENLDIQKELNEYHQYIEKRLKEECGITKSYIQLAFDRYFKKFILIAKKNYVGWLVNQEGRKVDYIHIRGLEAVKSDTCLLASNLLKELITLLLKTDNDENFYVHWLESKRQTIFNNIKPEDITIHKKISKEFHQYKSLPLSVEIAKRKVAKEGALIHKEINYIIIGRKGTKLNGIETKEFTGKFDREYYWNHLILPPLIRILKVVYNTIDWQQFTYYSFDQLKLF